jgi:hypothetical protein
MWNEVLRNFQNLKHRFIQVFCEEKLLDYGDYKTYIEYWASKFD